MTVADSLLDAVEDAIVVIDAELRVRFANYSARVVLGIAQVDEPGGAPDTLADIDTFAVIYEVDLERVGAALAEVLEAPRKKVVLRFRVHHPDGLKPVEAVATNFVDDPAIGGIIVCFRDLERETAAYADLQVERELRAANLRLQGELAERSEYLSRLLRIQAKISRRAPLEDVLEAVAGGAKDLLGDEVVGLRLRDPSDASQLVLMAWQGTEASMIPLIRTQPASEGVGGRAYVQNELVVVEDYQTASEKLAAFASGKCRCELIRASS